MMSSLKEDLKIDKKNNSRKSYLVLYFYRKLHNFFEKGNKVGFIFWSFWKSVVYFFLRIDAQISYKAVIGSDIRLPHSAAGVVISAKAIIGSHITIYHQVTIGINENKPIEEQKIIIHDNCYLSAGCKIISSEVGEGSKIGPNAVVYKDLPSNSLYVSSNMVLQ